MVSSLRSAGNAVGYDSVLKRKSRCGLADPVSGTNKLIICSIPQFEGKCKPLERSDDMSYYRTCQYCGANLDPGETCDCQIEKKEQETVRAEAQIREEQEDDK